MNDALLVRGFERVGDLSRDRQRLGQRDASRTQRRRSSVGARDLRPSTSSITSAVKSGVFSSP